MTQLNKQKALEIRVLFLDIDGVLNPINRTQDNMNEPDEKANNDNNVIIPKSHTLRLHKILKSVENCKFVLTSSWRKSQQQKQTLFDAIKKFTNLDVVKEKYYLSDTPIINDIDCMDKNNYAVYKRCNEIEKFLNRMKSSWKYKIVSHCIVDDLPLINSKNN
eukprot:406839_1